MHSHPVAPGRRAAAFAATAGLAGGALCGCSIPTAGEEEEATVQLQPVADGLQQVTLTEEGVAKIGIDTAKVRPAAGAGRVTMPYSALVYSSDGTTWAYTVTADRSYLRAAVTIESVAGDTMTLSEGPAVGTDVVVVGAPELLGAEAEISGEE
ncbi:MAG TPA: hypothetical protein VFJ97_09515 [Dermatophilaceae bacterium]|nr:hypothetical protein [Dermatophilaceae bacterium]